MWVCVVSVYVFLCMCVCVYECVWRSTCVSKATITAVGVPIEDFSRRQECYRVGPIGDRKGVLLVAESEESDKSGSTRLSGRQHWALVLEEW